jgi:ABC-type transporter Mla MlaB component
MAKKTTASSRGKRAALGNDPFAELSEASNAEEDNESPAKVSMPASAPKKASAAKKTTAAKKAPAAKTPASDVSSKKEGTPVESQPEETPDVALETKSAQPRDNADTDTVSEMKEQEEAEMAESNDVVLPEALMLPNAAEVAEEIAHALAVGQAFNLDASNVQRADTAGMQLLLAAVAQGRSQGLAVSLANPAEVVRSKAKILDLDKQLGL